MRNKKVWTAIGFLVALAIMTQPIAEIPLIGNGLTPISELFTLQTKSYFEFGIKGGWTHEINATKSIVVPIAIANGSLTLTGKGGNSVDNDLMMNVTLFFPSRLVGNFSKAKITFHPQNAFFYPVKYTNLGFERHAVLNITYLKNQMVGGRVIGQVWQGIDHVIYYVSGVFPAGVNFTSIHFKFNNTAYVDHAQTTTEPFIQISGEDVTSQTRNNELTVILTLAIIAFAVLDFRTKDSTQKYQPCDAQKPNQPAPTKKGGKR